MGAVLAAAALVIGAPLRAGVIDELLRVENADDPVAAVMANGPKGATAEFRVGIRFLSVENGRVAVTAAFGAGSENTERYFYPASTVKFPAAVAAVAKWRAIAGPAIPTAALDETNIVWDSEHGVTNLGAAIRLALVVSDNAAFNRLYDFVGHSELNDFFRDRGFSAWRISHRLAIFEPWPDSTVSPAMAVVMPGGVIGDVRTQTSPPAAIDTRFPDPILIGRSHIPPAGGELVGEPMDFRAKNAVSLRDLQDMLVALARPELLPDGRRGFGSALTESDRAWLIDIMARSPRGGDLPSGAPADLPDDYSRFLGGGIMAGADEPARPRIVGKSGLAYGFVTDNIWVVDPASGAEFFLAATVMANADGIVNDSRYEYDEVAIPFLREIGRRALDYARKRAATR